MILGNLAMPEITDFTSFWPYYVAAHRQRGCRALHYVGTTLATALLVWAAVTLQPLFVVAALVVGYGFAWVGHFAVEGNRPATFGHPFYSLVADYKMLAFALAGRMSDEVKRLNLGAAS